MLRGGVGVGVGGGGGREEQGGGGCKVKKGWLPFPSQHPHN